VLARAASVEVPSGKWGDMGIHWQRQIAALVVVSSACGGSDLIDSSEPAISVVAAAPVDGLTDPQTGDGADAGEDPGPPGLDPGATGQDPGVTGQDPADAGDAAAVSHPVVPVKQWSCPPGPFEPPVAGPAQPVCDASVFKYGWSEGPTWIASQSAFFFSNFVVSAAGPGDMIKFTPETGACETFIADVACNGLGVAPDGNILGACHGPRALMHYDVITREGTVLADRVDGNMLDSVNDVVAHSNGTIYFTNPTYELAGRPVGLGQAVLRRDPAGVISVVARGRVNGIALSPDEKQLYVVLQGVWDLDDQGVPSNPRSFPLGGDGIAVDCAGNIYDNAGVIRNPEGQKIGSFPAGTNMAFGGPDGKTLFVVRNATAYTVQMNIPGLP
jgi:gluconolactonase